MYLLNVDVTMPSDQDDLDCYQGVFLEALSYFNGDEIRKLFFFITATEHIPLTRKITITFHESFSRYPQSHTCFNELEIYPSRYDPESNLFAKNSEDVVLPASVEKHSPVGRMMEDLWLLIERYDEFSET